MNRLLSVLVAIFILFLLYIWINHLVLSPQTENSSEQEIENANIEAFEEYPLSNYKGEEHVSRDKEIQVKGSDGSQESNEDGKEDTDEAKTPPAPEEQKSRTKEPAHSALAGSNEHLVIAGNFLDRVNAQKRVDELKSFGYVNAEIVNFELSEYHTACAGRYGDLTEARRIARKIKDFHNIDTYVRNGNQP